MFFTKIATWINETPTNHALTDLYDAINGNYPPGITFIGRPAIGGYFAVLALEGLTDLY